MAPSFLVSVLTHGGIAVIPTDTIYGIVARAFDRAVVERLYALRRTTHRKPFIVLLDAISRLKEFGVIINASQRKFLNHVWPGKVSVIFRCPSKKFSYLHRGAKTVAFRLPQGKTLNNLLRKTGPLVAPSANPEGKKPAATIAAAKRYFGAQVDIYCGASRKPGKPSTLVSLLDSTPKVLREGAVDVTLPTADAVAYAKRMR